MDKVWDRKSFEVGGHWLLWWGWKSNMFWIHPLNCYLHLFLFYRLSIHIWKTSLRYGNRKGKRNNKNCWRQGKVMVEYIFTVVKQPTFCTAFSVTER